MTDLEVQLGLLRLKRKQNYLKKSWWPSFDIDWWIDWPPKYTYKLKPNGLLNLPGMEFKPRVQWTKDDWQNYALLLEYEGERRVLELFKTKIELQLNKAKHSRRKIPKRHEHAGLLLLKQKYLTDTKKVALEMMRLQDEGLKPGDAFTQAKKNLGYGYRKRFNKKLKTVRNAITGLKNSRKN